MPTQVVNIDQESCDVYVGRPSVWGNPFRVTPKFGRRAAIRAYETRRARQEHLLARLPELKDKRLGCHCAPLPCHGDVLARLADGAAL